MKAIVLKNDYGLSNIALQEQPAPTLAPHEVLVKVAAISLNQLDLMIAQGAFNTPLPHILGSDAAGVIEQVGSHVTAFNIGDHVTTHFIQTWQRGPVTLTDLKNRLGTDVQGVFAEYITLSQDSLIKTPATLSSIQAATLPIAGLTAWEALVNIGQLRPGQTLLLQGTGGVSVFALQFAKTIGANVIVTSSSSEKLARATALGADAVINYRETPNWQETVLQLTQGVGVDLALEISWKEIGKTIQAMKLGGKIIIVGLLGGAHTDLSVFGIMQKNLSLHGIQVGSKTSFAEMNHAIDNNKIAPVIDKIFPIAEFSAALEYFAKGNHFGKVVLEF